MCYVPVTTVIAANRSMATQDVTRPVFLPVIIDTPRQGRLTEPAANFVFGESAVCVNYAVPVASGAWRGPVLAKVLAPSLGLPRPRHERMLSSRAKGFTRLISQILSRARCSRAKILPERHCRNWSIQFGNTA